MVSEAESGIESMMACVKAHPGVPNIEEHDYLSLRSEEEHDHLIRNIRDPSRSRQTVTEDKDIVFSVWSARKALLTDDLASLAEALSFGRVGTAIGTASGKVKESLGCLDLVADTGILRKPERWLTSLCQTGESRAGQYDRDRLSKDELYALAGHKEDLVKAVATVITAHMFHHVSHRLIVRRDDMTDRLMQPRRIDETVRAQWAYTSAAIRFQDHPKMLQELYEDHHRLRDALRDPTLDMNGATYWSDVFKKFRSWSTRQPESADKDSAPPTRTAIEPSEPAPRESDSSRV